jgi:NADH-quinone oxidoreductase subunit A
MSEAFTSSLGIVAYLALFVSVGILFLLVNLLVGRLVRPVNPHKEKLEIYECGEPTIGSSFVQFDLRFYVVALLFIIFDVEVAFFFPWAAVFGKATLLDQAPAVAEMNGGAVALTGDARRLHQELGVSQPVLPTDVAGVAAAETNVRDGARRLAWMSMIDIAVFFAVLMMGFFYVWKRGDLDWVRAVSQERARSSPQPTLDSFTEEPVISA